jgi:ATP/maltotriose-dependent transcriptional regulator MalT
MDRSLGLALSVESRRLSLSTVSYDSVIALANDVKDSAEMQHSGASLSTRERTIVLLMGHGLTNKMIARRLSIAPETVKSHAKRIFWKLTVQTRAQAVYRASTLGLL